MNENRICFIASVQDEQLFDESMKYINAINVPDNFQVDVILVTEEKSVAKAYNEAMKSSDAKYKVYLNQGTFIINKNFINDVIGIFNRDKSIGMIGMTGSKTIPTSGVWRDSVNKYGETYSLSDDGIKHIKYKEVDGKYTNVQVIDGAIMITQYDIEWREDLFDSTYYYDVAQGLEFGFSGYKIVIPYQVKPWCIYEENIINNQCDYVKCKCTFLDKYYKRIFPLVSILIPTHNRPDYFRQALESAINQTYKNIEIIIGDDSDNNKTEELIQPYLKKCDNLVYNFQKNLDLESNWKMCLEKCNGEYINFLMDDDIFRADKIEKMINYYIEYPNVSIVTSYRQFIDKDGNIIEANNKIFQKTTIVSGKILGKYALMSMQNFIGEPTTVLFKKHYYSKLFIKYNNVLISGIGDLVRNLYAMSDGDCVYISEPLSCFRIHDGQGQKQIEIIKSSYSEWYELFNYWYGKHIFYDNKEEFCNSLLVWIRIVSNDLGNIRCSEVGDNQSLYDRLQSAMKIILDIK